jgi:UDP-N-acetylglucosamine--N-acetylmuramyl-(pentapeptide) pyrophosphoryl-undecaprenol N-acetylglucosamine transferase
MSPNMPDNVPLVVLPPALFVMAGGGTGGHVIPAIAVAREVCRMGYQVLFVGTERGVENRLVPAAGFRLEKIRVGGIKNLGIATRILSLWQLIGETSAQIARFREWRPAAVFSMGGYVAGPPVLAALFRGVPVVVMEPNAVPGFTNRRIARWVRRALINFEETKRFFPAGRTELTGLPVREEFFNLPPRANDEFTVLITGGSQGSRTLNEAARQSWPLFRQAALPVRLIHQAGSPMFSALSTEFRETGLSGEVSAFIQDMPGAFAQADFVVCRSGAGAVSELAAAGKPSILVPFPFAADQHQLKNAQAFERAGAARMSLDKDWNGQRFFDVVRELYENRHRLETMSDAARKLAHPGAARRAAEILVEVTSYAIDSAVQSRNNS